MKPRMKHSFLWTMTLLVIACVLIMQPFQGASTMLVSEVFVDLGRTLSAGFDAWAIAWLLGASIAIAGLARSRQALQIAVPSGLAQCSAGRHQGGGDR